MHLTQKTSLACCASLAVITASATAQPATFNELFKAPVFMDVGVKPVDVKAMDLNGDGRADLVVANNDRTQASINLFLSDGAGGFTNQSITSTFLLDPREIALSDVDNDGFTDLVVANGTGEDILTFLGQTGGVFNTQNPIRSFANDIAAGLDLAFINGDSDIDAVTVGTTNPFPNQVRFFSGLGSGAFDTPLIFSISHANGHVRLADLDEDGFQDAVVDSGSFIIRILPGDSSMIFNNFEDFPIQSDLTLFTKLGPPLIMKLDNDFTKEIIVAVDVINDISNNDHIAILRNKSNVSGMIDFYIPNEVVVVGHSPDKIIGGRLRTVVNLNDLIVTHINQDDLDFTVLLRGQSVVPTIEFLPQLTFALGQGISPTALALAYIDDDGDLDLIATVNSDNTSSTTNGQVAIFENLTIANADLNGDGVVDGADLAILLIQWGTNGPADLNGDGNVDGVDLAILLINWTDTENPPPAMAQPDGRSGDTLADGGLVDGPGAGDSGQAGSAPDVPWVLAYFGFDSIHSYMDWLNLLTDDELADHIVEVIELIQNH